MAPNSSTFAWKIPWMEEPGRLQSMGSLCKEQHCKGTWNIWPMIQGKLEVVKQEMERVNIDILAISELKWT